MIYELRTYHVAPGRLTDLHARLRDDVPPLFARHKLWCIGRWSIASGAPAPAFIYLIAHESYAAREASWAALYGDPQWHEIRARSNGTSEMVERYDLWFLKLAAGWTPRAAPPPGDKAGSIGGLHEMVSHQAAIGQATAVNQFMDGVWVPGWRAGGATVMGVFDVASGTDLPRQVIFLAWADAQERHAGWQALEKSGELARHANEQRERLGVPLIGASEHCLLEPAAYELPTHPWADAP